MVKAPSKILLIVAIVMALFALIVVNQIGQKNVPKTGEEQEAEEQKEAQDAASKEHDAQPVKAPPVAGPKDDLVSLGSDAVRGPASSAAPEVTVRWSWTPTTQSNPDKLNSGIKALLSAAPNARVHIVNTDETPGVPDGVFVGGKVITPAAPDGSVTIDPSAVKAALGK